MTKTLSDVLMEIYMRKHGTTTTGNHFALSVVEAVWQKGAATPGVDPTLRRKDAGGAWIDRNRYGETSNTGWEIDHVFPVAHGGTDNLDNLQPLQWENNRSKGDSPYFVNYPITARA